MKENKAYKSWRQDKRQIDMSQNFSDRVMIGIYQLEQNSCISRFNIERLIEQISFHPLVIIGLVASGAVAGIVRLIIMINAVLSNGVING